MMKKILLCVLAVLVSMLTTVQAFAASSVSISLSSSKSAVGSGDRFTVAVQATVDSCGSGGIDVSYNSDVFRMVESKCVLSNTALSGSDVFAFENNTRISGKAFEITFEVKSGAPLGSSGITVKFKADSKTASKTINVTVACDHAYSDSCDTTCNKCGATRSISHSWNSGEVTKAATCKETGTKKLTCKVCGATTTETVSKTAHKYDNGCDKDCNVCGATRTTSHDYKWESDASEHWQECANCGEEKDRGSHTPAAELSGNELGHGHLCSVCGLMPDRADHTFPTDCDATCTDCGYTRTVTHNYSQQWQFDAGGHYHACTICGDKMEKYVHTPGDAATETTDQICTECGFVIEVSGNHKHVKTGEWLADDQGHWFLCTCYNYTTPEPHTWDKGTVDETAGKVTYKCTICGHTKEELYVPETAPEKQPTEGESAYTIPQLYVYIALGVLAASLAGNTVLIILVCAKGRKGKFTK